MNEITIPHRICGRPGRVIKFFDPGMLGVLDWPLRVLVDPAPLGLHGRFADGIDNDINVGLPQTLGEMSDEQLSSPILCRWN